MGGTCAFRVARIVPPSVQNYHFTMPLEASPCTLPVGVTCLRWWFDLVTTKFFFPSLPPNIVVWPSWLLTFQLQFLLF